MTTLQDFEIKFQKSPCMLAAVKRALLHHASETEALVVSGQASFHKSSNCSRAALRAGWNTYEIYAGARNRYRTEGTVNILVKI